MTGTTGIAVDGRARPLAVHVSGRLRTHLAQRWPHIRRALPRDLVLLLWAALLAQAFGIAVVMTDSVHTSLALVIKGVRPKPGELAVFAYSGEALPGYYRNDRWDARLIRLFGRDFDSRGPRRGDGFVKYLIGLPGDRIEHQGNHVVLVTARGRLDMGACKPTSRAGVPLTPIAEQVIPEGQAYVWAPHVDALDSRYAVMGLVPISTIVGRAVRLL